MFGKVTGHVMDTRESITLLYTSNERAEAKIEGATPLAVAPNETEYLGVSLTKHARNPYAENDTMLMAKGRDDVNKRRHCSKAGGRDSPQTRLRA